MKTYSHIRRKALDDAAAALEPPISKGASSYFPASPEDPPVS
ncbi:MAG: hypothetical protein ABI999_00750 [Acidobacteriota bacterium]